MSLDMTFSSGAEFINSARRLQPSIIELRDEIERQRRVPPALLSAMHEARLFKMLVPREIGGLECDPIISMRVVEETAIADGAAAWVLMLGSTYGLWAAFLAEDVAQEIFGAVDAVVAGALRPSGRATAVKGGFVVNGRWGFASGIDNAAWWNGGCVVYDAATPRRSDTGAVETRLVFFLQRKASGSTRGIPAVCAAPAAMTTRSPICSYRRRARFVSTPRRDPTALFIVCRARPCSIMRWRRSPSAWHAGRSTVLSNWRVPSVFRAVRRCWPST
jgi:alkylation response protein AidB-like acyl-CoA dehydrogenase